MHPILYDLIAVSYRRFIIKRSLNHFAHHCFLPDSQILHAGCGSGEVDADIRRDFDISALDFSVPALSIYRKHHGDGARLLHGSIFDIPVSAGTYQGIYNLGVMEHFTEEEIKRILNEFHRVLKPDGKILLFWPPVFGLSVRFLAAVHWILRRRSKKKIKLHPEEVTHVRSRKQVEKYLTDSGFAMETFYFGIRDLFTYAVIEARRTEPAPEPSGIPREGQKGPARLAMERSGPR